MDFRKMESFLTLAHTGKFVTAAEKLFVSQSSLSKQMAQLEQELGVKLFKKTRNGVVLTQAGEDFYGYARKAVPEYQHAISRLKTFEKENAPLVVGSIPLAEEYGFADACSAYWVRNTSTDLQYVERNQEDILDKLKRRKVDIAFARVDYLDDSWFEHSVVMDDELALVCSSKDPLAQKTSVTVSELRDRTFILLVEKSWVTRIFLDRCREAYFRPHAPLHHSRHRMIAKAVQQRMGITVLSPRLVSSFDHPEDIVCIPFDPPMLSTLGFVWNKDEKPSSTAMEFVNFMGHYMRQRHKNGQGT